MKYHHWTFLELLEKNVERSTIKKSLEEIKEKLSLCKGAILAYEHLLQGTPSNGTRFDKEIKRTKIICPRAPSTMLLIYPIPRQQTRLREKKTCSTCNQS